VSFFCRELADERERLDELPLLDDRDLLLDDRDLLLDARRPLPDLLEEPLLLDFDLEPWLAMCPLLGGARRPWGR
jgi:hypothetical protein